MDREELRKAMSNAQEMQVNLLKVQTELALMELNIKSPDGMIELIMTAQGDFKDIKLNPELLKQDKESIEKSLIAALGNATEQAAKLTKEKLAEVSKSIGL